MIIIIFLTHTTVKWDNIKGYRSYTLQSQQFIPVIPEKRNRNERGQCSPSFLPGGYG